MAENLKKRPTKGILKSSTSFEKQEQAQLKAASRQKETKWDEMNIMATLHPADKDYGHMKIEEPKTPYNWANEELESMDVSDGKGIDAMALAEKISTEANQLPTVCQEEEEESEEEEEELPPEQKARKNHFESKRKMHYNEFQAVKLARKLMEEEDDEDEEDVAASSSTSNKDSEHEEEEEKVEKEEAATAEKEEKKPSDVE
ncbi:protein phosphatase inhibitor 2-like [Cloeon dipterum]|uniref:protein phosphatase inhibitor 2-like n=1 Tax=Cloeon dipterum TaxID=197152 RepID=UPI00321FC0DB